MNSPWWLSARRRLWLDIPWQVECEHVSKQVPTLCLDSSTVSLLWLPLARWSAVFQFFQFCCADLSVPALPSCVQYTWRSSVHMIKIASPPFENRRPNRWWYGNSHTTRNRSRLLKMIIVATPSGRRRKGKKKAYTTGHVTPPSPRPPPPSTSVSAIYFHRQNTLHTQYNSTYFQLCQFVNIDLFVLILPFLVQPVLCVL